MKVFVTRPLVGDALERLAAHHDVHVWDHPLPPPRDVLLEEAATADALIVTVSDRVDDVLLATAARLTAVSTYAVGFENIDVRAATSRRIAVGNTPDVLTDATAQFALALTLDMVRRVNESARHVRAGRWDTWQPSGYLGRVFGDVTVGIIGWGKIGRAYGALVEALGMTVLHTGSHSFDQVLERADVVSLHVPLTEGTRSLIDSRAFSLLRPGAFIVNTSRGQVVDTPALLDALDHGTLAGAALDVTDPEPLPPDHPLLGRDDVLVTPHIASATDRSRAAMADRAVDNILKALAGLPMEHCVNPDVYRARD